MSLLIQSCTLPPPCLSSLKVTAGGKTVVDFPLLKPAGAIILHDAKGKGVPVTAAIVSKCKADPAGCPKGLLYEKERFDPFTEILPAAPLDAVVKYSRELTAPAVVEFIKALWTGDFGKIPTTDYRLVFGECWGKEPEVQQLIGPYKFATHPLGTIVQDNDIRVFPNYVTTYNFSLGVGLKEEHEVQQETKVRKFRNPHGKKKIVKKKNTNILVTNQTEAVTAKGTISFEIADASPVEFGSTDITQQCTEYRRKLPPLQKASEALRSVNAIFGATSTGQASIADCRFIPPKFSFEGKCELKVAENEPYWSHKTTFKLDPLIGFSLTLDLLQALASFLGVQPFARYIKEKAAEMEREYNEGKRKSYAGVQLELVLESGFNLEFTLDAQKRDAAAVTLAAAMSTIKVSVDTNVRVGIKRTIIEGAFEIGATAFTKGFFELERKGKQGIEGVFYHNGAEAEVHLETSFGKKDSQDRSGESKNKMSFEPQETTESSKTFSRKWTIYDALPKEESTYRMEFI